MENIAAFKPVSTSPPRSTCGIPERSSYCRSPSSQSELMTCYQAFCIQECPYRSSTPPYAPLLLAAHRYEDQTSEPTIKWLNLSHKFDKTWYSFYYIYLKVIEKTQIWTFIQTLFHQGNLCNRRQWWHSSWDWDIDGNRCHFSEGFWGIQ